MSLGSFFFWYGRDPTIFFVLIFPFLGSHWWWLCRLDVEKNLTLTGYVIGILTWGQIWKFQQKSRCIKINLLESLVSKNPETTMQSPANIFETKNWTIESVCPCRNKWTLFKVPNVVSFLANWQCRFFWPCYKRCHLLMRGSYGWRIWRQKKATCCSNFLGTCCFFLNFKS